MSQHESLQHNKVDADVSGIALRALATLVAEAREQDMSGANGLCAEAIHETLLSAVTGLDDNSFERAVTELVAQGVARRDIANIHVPKIARTLGQAWLDDRMEFTNVSIGCARLQGYLRRKGLDWCDAAALEAPWCGSALLLVPDFEQHTLGATLLAGQLRAQGVCVVTKLNATLDEMLQATHEHDFDAILISSSRSATVALLCTVVQTLKQARNEVPILIGGSVLEQIPNITKKTGADFSANCSEDALSVITSLNKGKAALPGAEG